MSDVQVIELFPIYIECAYCDAADLCKWGIPVSMNAEIVDNDYEGEWGGTPACRVCYEAHQQGLLTEATRYEWRKRQQLIRRAMDAAFRRA